VTGTHSAFLRDRPDRGDRKRYRRRSAHFFNSVRTCAHGRRSAARYFHSLSQVLRELDFFRSLKFIGHRRILLLQYVIAAGFTYAALHSYSFGILRQQKTCGKQKRQRETHFSHKITPAAWDARLLKRLASALNSLDVCFLIVQLLPLPSALDPFFTDVNPGIAYD